MPLLISMQEDERALVKAIESGDTDLGESLSRLSLLRESLLRSNDTVC